MTNTKTNLNKTAQLNDRFRQTYWGGKVMITSGVQALPCDKQAEIFNKVRDYDNFTPDNDPYGEHDFGTITINKQKIFWKIDYYDNKMEFGSEDPTNPNVTTRVLTIMLANEY